MCLIAVAWKAVAHQPLVLVANRDEFHARPTAPLAWWADHPTLLAGRDLKEGGTWLGVSRGGRVAAVTNVRGAEIGAVHPRSRGALVRDFLLTDEPALTWADALQARAAAYGAFNLLLYDGEALVHASNRPHSRQQLVDPGYHGLSNADLDTAWPKVVAARGALEGALAARADDDTLLDLLRDERRAADAALPDTGVGLAWERRLSPSFIRGEVYGTRATTLLCIDADHRIRVVERSFDAAGKLVHRAEASLP